MVLSYSLNHSSIIHKGLSKAPKYFKRSLSLILLFSQFSANKASSSRSAFKHSCCPRLCPKKREDDVLCYVKFDLQRYPNQVFFGCGKAQLKHPRVRPGGSELCDFRDFLAIPSAVHIGAAWSKIKIWFLKPTKFAIIALTAIGNTSVETWNLRLNFLACYLLISQLKHPFFCRPKQR